MPPARCARLDGPGPWTKMPRCLPGPTSSAVHLLALFALVATIYFATFSGVTASNDGSHYALVRALVSQRSFEISPYLAFTENQDFATGPGGRYSDRPPGTAIWAAPFYAAARLLPPPLVEAAEQARPRQPAPARGRGGDRARRRRRGRALLAAAAPAASAARSSPAAWPPSRWRSGPRPGSTARSCTRTASRRCWSCSRSTSRCALARAARRPACCSASRSARAWSSSTATRSSSRSCLPTWPRRAWRRPAPARWPARARACSAAWRCRSPSSACTTRSTSAAPGASRPSRSTWSAGRTRPACRPPSRRRWPTGWPGCSGGAANNQGLFLLSPVAWLALPGIPAMLRGRRLEAGAGPGHFVAFLLLFAKSTNFNP